MSCGPYPPTPDNVSYIEEIDVSTYGAVGDGATDDHDAIVKAIMAAPTRHIDAPTLIPGQGRPTLGAIIRFPATTDFYRISRCITIPANRLVSLVGSPGGGSTIRLIPSPYTNKKYFGPIPPTPVFPPAPFPAANMAPPPYPHPPLPCPVDSKVLGQWLRIYGPMWEAYWDHIRANYCFYVSGNNAWSEALMDDYKEVMTESKKAYLATWEKENVFAGGDGQNPFSMEDLTLEMGGVLFSGSGGTSGQSQRWTAFRGCTFRNAPRWGLRTDGITIVNVEVSGCVFEGGNGGIEVRNSQCDVWLIRRCSFSNNTGIDLTLGSSGAHVEACTFGLKPSKAAHLPYLWLKEGPDPSMTEDGVPETFRSETGREKWAEQMTCRRDVRFIDCLFGYAGSVPRDFAVVGPLADGAYTDWRYLDDSKGSQTKFVNVTDIVFDGCVFGSTGYVASESQGRSGFRMTAPASYLQLIGCTMDNLQTFILEEAIRLSREDGMMLAAYSDSQLPKSDPLQGAFANHTERVRAVSRGSYGNVIAYPLLLGKLGRLFSEGGRGFELVGRYANMYAQRGADPRRAGGNLLCGPEANGTDEVGWTRLAPVGARVSPGLDEEKDGAWSLASGSDTLKENINFTAQLSQVLPSRVPAVLEGGGGPAVFSVWLKAGATTRARLEVAAGEVTIGGTGKEGILLTPDWQRYHVVVEKLPSAFPEGTATLVLPPVLKAKAASVDAIEEITLQGTRMFEGQKARGIVLRIILGDSDNGDGMSHVFASRPQFEVGDVPTAYVGTKLVGGKDSTGDDVDAVISVPRGDQWLMIGPMMLGIATVDLGNEPTHVPSYESFGGITPSTKQVATGAAPSISTGIALPRGGDAMLNLEPVEGEYIGWVWIEKSKEWMRFGKIDAP